MDDTRSKHLVLLVQHYDATFTALGNIWSQRNHAALYLYIVAIAQLVPELQIGLLKKVIGADKEPPSEMLSLLGLVVLLALIALLGQRTRYLDAAYVYLAGIEQRMEKLAGYPMITREGRYYWRKFDGLTFRKPVLSVRYHVLYDLLPVVLVGAILLWRWTALGATVDNASLAYILLMPVLTIALLYVMVAFLWEREVTVSNSHLMNAELLKMLDTVLAAPVPPPTAKQLQLTINMADIPGA